MGLLDDAIRDHLELKRAHGAAEEEVRRQEQEALGPARGPAAAPLPAESAPPTDPDLRTVAPAEERLEEAPAVEEPPAEEPPAEEPPAAVVAEPAAVPARRPDPEPWLEDPDEVPAEEALDRQAAQEDVLEETPEFLQETPEHDRLWFEQKPPRGFDFDQ